MQTVPQTDIVPMMQEASSAVQTQDHKGAVQEQTAMCIALQTLRVIQIQIIVMHSYHGKNNDVKYYFPGHNQK